MRRAGGRERGGGVVAAPAAGVAAHPKPPGARPARPGRFGPAFVVAALAVAAHPEPARPGRTSSSPPPPPRRTRSRSGPGRTGPAFVTVTASSPPPPSRRILSHPGPGRPGPVLPQRLRLRFHAPVLRHAAEPSLRRGAGALWAGGGRPGGQAAGGGAKRHAGIKLISFQYDQCLAEGRGNVRQARPRHGRSGPIPLSPAQRRGEGAGAAESRGR